MQYDPADTNEVTSAPAEELYYIVAAVAAHYGDTDGKYAAFLARVHPDYPKAPYFAWNQPIALPAGYKVSGSINAVSANSDTGKNGGGGGVSGNGDGGSDSAASLSSSIIMLTAAMIGMQLATRFLL